MTLTERQIAALQSRASVGPRPECDLEACGHADCIAWEEERAEVEREQKRNAERLERYQAWLRNGGEG